jgi:putative PEP-CTERM system TPR-repeat lipoprotein
MTVRRTLLRGALLQLWLVFAAACGAQTPDQLLAEARQAIGAGELRTADIHLKNLLQQEPDNVVGRQLLGEVSLAQGDPAAAEQNLRRALELGGDSSAIQLPLLRALLVQGKYRETVQQVELGPRLTGEDQATALVMAGNAHRSLGSLEAAEAAYGAALEINPGSPDARTELATMLLSRGRAQDAAQLIADVLADRPDFAPALLLRAALERRTGRYDIAEATLEEILQLEIDQRSPTYTLVLAQLVELELVQGKIDEGAAHADALLSAVPESPTAAYIKARVETEQQDLDGAERRLEGVIAGFPEYWPAYTLLGSINARQGQVEQARAYLRTAVTNNPDDNAARLSLAEVYVRDGDISAAKDVISNASPDAGNMFFAIAGRASLQAGNPNLASEYFERSEGTAPTDLQTLVGLSSVYMSAGEFERAIRVIETSSLEEGDNEGVRDYLLTLLHLRQGDAQAAASTSQRLVDRLPNDAWPLNLRGTVALVSNELPAARELFLRAVELDPDFVPALLNLARAAVALNDKEQAAEHLRRVLQIEPQQPVATLGLAVLAAARGDVAEARRWLEQTPASPTRYQLQGELAMAENRFDEAAMAFSRGFELQPSATLALRSYAAATRAGRPQPESQLLAFDATNQDDPRVDFALGSIALASGNQDDAIARFQAVVQQVPAHGGALNNLAWLYGERGDQRAVEFGERAYAAEPNNPAIADTLGWLHVQSGDAAKGLPLVKQATEALPNQREIRYHWAVALAESGDSTQALSVLEALLATGDEFPGRDDARARVAELRRD